MFDSWKQVKDHFKEPNIYKMLDTIFKSKEVKDEAIAFNHDQLFNGFDANDKDIRTFAGGYSINTIQIKKAKGQPVDRITLKDTGKFYDTFKVFNVPGGYEIKANFNKPDGSILDNFDSSFDFTGLTDASLIELVMEDILPRLSQMIKDQYIK